MTNGYISFYYEQTYKCYAPTRYEAHKQAMEYFKPPKSQRHMVHTHLAEKDGETITHTPTE